MITAPSPLPSATPVLPATAPAFATTEDFATILAGGGGLPSIASSASTDPWPQPEPSTAAGAPPAIAENPTPPTVIRASGNEAPPFAASVTAAPASTPFDMAEAELSETTVVELAEPADGEGIGTGQAMTAPVVPPPSPPTGSPTMPPVANPVPVGPATRFDRPPVATPPEAVPPTAGRGMSAARMVEPSRPMAAPPAGLPIATAPRAGAQSLAREELVHVPAVDGASFDLSAAPAWLHPSATTAIAVSAPVPIWSVASPSIFYSPLPIDPDGLWVDRLAQEIGAMTGGGAARFSLAPEHLGRISVEVSQHEGGTSVRIQAEEEAARALLLTAQERLAVEARAQGVRIADVSIGGGAATMAGTPDDRRAPTNAPLANRSAPKRGEFAEPANHAEAIRSGRWA